MLLLQRWRSWAAGKRSRRMGQMQQAQSIPRQTDERAGGGAAPSDSAKLSRPLGDAEVLAGPKAHSVLD